jgi:hypothetical protein
MTTACAGGSVAAATMGPGACGAMTMPVAASCATCAANACPGRRGTTATSSPVARAAASSSAKLSTLTTPSPSRACCAGAGDHASMPTMVMRRGGYMAWLSTPRCASPVAWYAYCRHIHASE